MADGTKIEWTDATWNPITGCAVVSPGCTNCYAMKLAGTRLKHIASRKGLTKPSKAGPVWTGEVRFNEEMLDQPLRWKRPRMIFVCAHGDLFADNVPDEWIDKVFAIMALAPQHTFQVLTKRPERMRQYLQPFDQRRSNALGREVHELGYRGPLECLNWPLRNVWLGVSVEDQERADERIPILLDTPAAVRWISAEPLLGPIDLLPYLFIYTHEDEAHLELGVPFLPFRDPATTPAADISSPRLDWVVAGGESGQGARPMHPDWVRSLRDQCADAQVAFHFKQWGEYRPAHSIAEAGSYPKLVAGPENRSTLQSECFHTPMQVAAYLDGSTLSKAQCAVARVGKKEAGRLLDGVTHDGFPARETPDD
jgi:protein gp37